MNSSKILSLLLTGKTRIGVTKGDNLKKVFVIWEYSVIQKVVENMKLPFACSECIVQITRQNQLQAGLFVPEQRCLRMACHFSFMHVLQNLRSRDDPTGLTHERTRLEFHYI